MGFTGSCSAVLVLVAAATASLEPQQPLLTGYAKYVQPFSEYNLPFAPRGPQWRRAVEIQSPGGLDDMQQPQYEHSMLMRDFPMPSQEQQQRQREEYERSMVLREQQQQQQQQQQAAEQMGGASTNDMPDVQQPKYEHSMLMVDFPNSVMKPLQPQDQMASTSDEPTPADGPVPQDPSQRPLRLADQQPPTQEAVSGQGNPGVYQVAMPPPPPRPVLSGQWNSQVIRLPDGTILQQPRPVGLPIQPDGPLFRSSEPFPALSPPPVYSAPLGGRPVYISGSSEFVQDQQEGGPAPVGMQRPMEGPVGSFGMRPYPVNRMAPAPYPAYGRVPPPVQYEDEALGTGVSDAELSEGDQPQEEESQDKGGDQKAPKEETDEDTVKDLKDAVDVEEEVVPALVVFLRKKGHKALHDKDSVGIPGKENRFRRSPGGGSGSSSHSSSSSSSSSGPVYFGDGSGSYSSSQSSASSSSGGGAPLGFGAGAPGLGGSGSFYGGASVPSGGFGASGYGNTGVGGGYGGTGGAGLGGGHGGGYGGGVGGTGYGTTGYGPGYGSSGGSGGGGGYGGGGCATCGGDGNVLLNRFGEAEPGAGPFTVGGSGVSTGKGVHASSSSSIDSSGKVTYSTFAGKH